MTADFSRRSEQRELIDDMTVGGAEGRRMLAELRTVNRLLGGYRTTLGALDKLLAPRAEPWRLLDVGTGSGDIPEQVARWARRRGVPVRITAIDLNPATVAEAADRLAGFPEITVRTADVLALPFAPGDFDVSMCALFLHHFPDPDAGRVLSAMAAVSRVAVVVNDLHRHPLGYYGFRLCSTLFSGSPLVRHDGPLSVLRAFSRADWDRLSAEAGLPAPQVEWCWAFRWRVIWRMGTGSSPPAA